MPVPLERTATIPKRESNHVIMERLARLGEAIRVYNMICVR